MSALLAFVGISHLWKHYEKMLNFSLIADIIPTWCLSMFVDVNVSLMEL